MGAIDEAMNAVIAIYKIYRGKREKEESMFFVYAVAIGILLIIGLVLYFYNRVIT